MEYYLCLVWIIYNLFKSNFRKISLIDYWIDYVKGIDE